MKRANFLWELWTGLYMMDPIEKAVFNSVILATLSLAVYYAYGIFGGGKALEDK